MIRSVLLGFLLTVGPPCAAADPEEVLAVLDEPHQAAAGADGERYFAQFADEAVFLGTAAEERWALDRFREFVKPYFERGRGWSYVPRESARNVDFAPGGRLAWFDELLDNEKYGLCRATGVLRLIRGEWKIVQYSLTIPIPNEIALDVVAMIRAAPSAE
jgi:hypothetical protein